MFTLFMIYLVGFIVTFSSFLAIQAKMEKQIRVEELVIFFVIGLFSWVGFCFLLHFLWDSSDIKDMVVWKAKESK